MIDLFYTTLGIFFIFLIPFLIIKYMKIFNLILLFTTFILIIVLLNTEENYQKIALWKHTEEYNPIQKTEFLPIKSIKVLAYPAKDISDFDFIKTDGIFSIVKNEEYSKECLKNYFVKITSECPITDIIVKTTSISPEGYTNQKIANNIYLHYTNEKNWKGHYMKVYQLVRIIYVIVKMNLR